MGLGDQLTPSSLIEDPNKRTEPEPVIKAPELKLPDGIKAGSLVDELWREYDFGGRVYRIDNPVTLFMRTDRECTTHRVLDAKGVMHLCPAPGRQGCAIRWMPKDPTKPCQW